MSTEHRFSFAADLLYPAALGAGIAWWVEGFIGWRAHESPTRLALWTLTFGLFFIAYHGRNFLVLRDEYGGANGDGSLKSTRYHSTTFTRDVVDCAALIAGFVCLRFPGGKMRFADPFGVYLVALLIPLTALITDFRWGDKSSWIGRAVALLPPIAGLIIACHVGEERFDPSLKDGGVLLALVILLVLYLISPGRFYGVRKHQDISETEFRGIWRSIRVGAAVLASLVVLWIAAYRIRFEPSEARLENWVLVGSVDRFAIGRPCSTDPALEHQITHVDSLLTKINPARIKLVGSADTIPLTEFARQFVGTNAGLAHYRTDCVQRWLVKTGHFAGVEFQSDGDAPSRLDGADPLDRAVIVWAVVKDTAMLRKR